MPRAARILLSTLAIAGAALCARPVLADTLGAGVPDGAGYETGYIESGQASWYGPRHEGLRTTSGERFDSSKLTAAHASLPLGSYVRVTVQQTGRSIVVRVNDREPPHGVRCIDLSHAAAERLGIAARGVADVSLAEATPDEATEVAEVPEEAGLGARGRGQRAARTSTGQRGRLHTRPGHQ